MRLPAGSVEAAKPVVVDGAQLCSARAVDFEDWATGSVAEFFAVERDFFEGHGTSIEKENTSRFDSRLPSRSVDDVCCPWALSFIEEFLSELPLTSSLSLFASEPFFTSFLSPSV